MSTTIHHQHKQKHTQPKNRQKQFAVISLFPLIIHAAETDAPRETLESVVAVVNSDVITRTDLDNRLRTVKLQLEQQHAPLPSEATLEKQVLDRMIFLCLFLLFV